MPKSTNIYKAHPEANFLQSEKWAAVNEKLGHKTRILDFKNGNSALCIVKNAKRGRYLEIPGGPLLDWTDKKLVKTAFSEIFQLAKSEKCVFVRFRPQLLNTPGNLDKMQALAKITGLHFEPAPFHLHAQNTVILDLEKPADAILAEMRRQTRYEVRRAEKLALKVEKSHSKEMFHEFHSVQVETARRQNFIPPTEEDLLAYHEVFGEDATIYKVTTTQPISSDGKKIVACPEETSARGAADRAEIAKETTRETGAAGRADTAREDGAKTSSRAEIAKEDGAKALDEDLLPAGSVICYGVILRDGPEAEYFEAASTELGHKLPGAYALQWQVIRDLQEQKVSRYNLWGIAPPDPATPGEHLKNHRYSRVTTFKTGFGGTQTDFIPAVDLIVSPSRYKLTYLIETVRKKRRHLS